MQQTLLDQCISTECVILNMSIAHLKIPRCTGGITSRGGDSPAGLRACPLLKRRALGRPPYLSTFAHLNIRNINHGQILEGQIHKVDHEHCHIYDSREFVDTAYSPTTSDPWLPLVPEPFGNTCSYFEQRFPKHHVDTNNTFQRTGP